MSTLVALALLGCGGDGAGTKPPPSGPEVCDNGADDDGDLAADCDDAECGCPEVCDNLQDDNGDGLLDCADPLCTDACTEDCWAIGDEDRDGLADCDDSDCPTGCAESCDGGVDEDQDGLFDCDDPDCAPSCDLDGDGHVDVALGGDDCDDRDAAIHPDEDERCNGVDDDCDELVDDEDPGVVDATDLFADEDGDGYGGEAVVRCEGVAGLVDVGGDCDDDDSDVNPEGSEICNGGVDDDCDSFIDDQDPDLDPSSFVSLYDDDDLDGVGVPPATGIGCVPGPGESLADDDCDDGDDTVYPGAAEVCDDLRDDDCDLDVDCDDADCAASVACGAGGCVDVALASPVPILTFGSTVGMNDDVTPSCAPSTSPDVTFTWTPPAVGMYVMDTAGSTFDTVLHVIDGCGGVELACNDDDPALGLQSRITVNVYIPSEITIVIDGFQASSGSYVLNIY